MPQQLRPSLIVLLAVASTLSGCGGQTGSQRTIDAEKQRPATQSALPDDAAGAAAVHRFAAKGLPIYCGGRSKPWIALTFDDGPGPYTKHVLALLNRHKAARTFFSVGRNVRPYRSALLREQRGGAAIGNHSWSHPELPSLSAREQRAQVLDTNRAITRVTREPVRLFRPPYGEHDSDTDRITRGADMATILWDIDSRDALGASSKEISRIVKRGFHPGAIVLMHENRGQTVRALHYTILPALKKSGLTTVTVPQMLAGNPPSDRQLKRGRKGCPR